MNITLIEEGDVISIEIPEAKDVEFYIKARMIIDDIFKNKEEMKPKTWECFRSLYFDDKEKSGGKVRCKKMY